MIISLLFIFILSIFVTYYFSKYFNLYDYPNSRKQHSLPTIFSGGVSLCLCYSSLIYFLEFNEIINDILIFSFVIMLLGLIDDIKNLDVYIRLFLQSVIIYTLIQKYNLNIDNIGEYNFGSINLGSFSDLFTVCCVLTIINAKNYFDGIHGLCSSLFILCIFNLYLMIFIFNDVSELNILILVSPVLIFLLFNIRAFKLPRIFLGDNGSNMLGFIFAFVSLYLVKLDNNNINSNTIVWPMALLVYEFLATTLSRILRKNKIFTPGKDHLHYLLNSLLKSKVKTVLIIISINQIIFLTGIYISEVFFMPSIILFIFGFLIYFYIRERFLLL